METLVYFVFNFLFFYASATIVRGLWDVFRGVPLKRVWGAIEKDGLFYNRL